MRRHRMRYNISINPEYTYWHNKDKFFRFGPEPDKYQVNVLEEGGSDIISTHTSYKEALQALKKKEEA